MAKKRKPGVFSFSGELGRRLWLLLIPPLFLSLPSFSSLLPFLLRCRAATVPPVWWPRGWKATAAVRLCSYS
jgi:hypothetical protein